MRSIRVGILLLLLCPWSQLLAAPEVPLEVLLRSEAARVLFHTAAGERFATRVLGFEPNSWEAHWRIANKVKRGEAPSSVGELDRRMRRALDLFGRKFPERAKIAFERPQLRLSPAEVAELESLGASELSSEHFEFLESGQGPGTPARSFVHERARFLDEQGSPLLGKRRLDPLSERFRAL